MIRKNTLIDYANLGANLVQTTQLSGVRRGLENQNEMAATELAIEEGQAKLRESIFQTDTLLRNLTRARLRNENIVGVLALARETIINMKRNPISPLLREYTDKERLRSIGEGFESLANECSSAMSPVDRERAEKCAQYRTEESNLRAAISVNETWEKLDVIRAELKALEAQTGSTVTSKSVMQFGGICLVIGCILVGIHSIDGDDISPVGWLLLLVGGLVAAIGAAVFLPRWRVQTHAKMGEKSRKARALESQIVTMALKGEDLGEWRNKSLVELRQIQQERTAFVAKLLAAD